MPAERSPLPSGAQRPPRVASIARFRSLLALVSGVVALVVGTVACASFVSASNGSGPIVIRSGGTYSGQWESLDPAVPAVFIQTSEPVVIENSTIRGRGHLIATEHGRYAHVTVRNVRGEALAPTVAGRSPGRFLSVDTFAHVTVENSHFVGTSGIYLGASRPGATVQVLRNRALNIDGRIGDGRGGFLGNARVQFLQIDGGVDLTSAEIAWNHVENEPFKSGVEDVINFHKTSGTAGDPIRVHHNYIQGAYAVDPTTGPFSGGGIVLGDAGGAYVHAYANYVVGTSNYGIGIAGGRHNQIYDNRVISCGYLPDGTTAIAAQNVGIVVWNHYDQADFGHNVVFGNAVAWAHPDHGRNDYWVPDAARWEGNLGLLEGGPVPCAAEAEEFARWQVVVADAGLVIGRTAP